MGRSRVNRELIRKEPFRLVYYGLARGRESFAVFCDFIYMTTCAFFFVVPGLFSWCWE